MATAMFDVERTGATIILTLVENLGELNFVETTAKEALDVLNDFSVKNVVMDFSRTEYFGSTSLGFFIKLWKLVTQRHGSMVFCNLSEHEREILKITRLDTSWTICETKEEALKVVGL